MRIANGVAVGLLALLSSVAMAGDLPSYTQPNSKPGADDAIVRKLTARDVTERLFKATAEARPDLKGLNLTQLDLADLDFKRALLDGADLYASDITRANLSGSSLVGARLDRVTLTGADFSGADLTEARILRPTVFTSLQVSTGEAPKFVGAKLVRMISDGWLDRADFTDADLSDAVLGRAATREPSPNSPPSLVGANFTRAVLKEVKLAGTPLKYARFVDADLSGANLRGTDLSKADFTGANIAGADFTGANLDEADLRGVRGLDQAIGLMTATNYNSARRDPIP
jgi:uncharacterized protein YjbI with pentapeptide repeats